MAWPSRGTSFRSTDLADEWRRRESNPRPRSHRQSVYKLRLPLKFARRPVSSRPTAGLAILRCRALGDWLSRRAEPVRWRRYPSHGPSSERRRSPNCQLGSECEIVLRTYVGFPVVLRGRPRHAARAQVAPLAAKIHLVHDIRGRPGFDVVGSPAELQAEVAGWPRKSTGNKSKCEERSRTRRLT